MEPLLSERIKRLIFLIVGALRLSTTSNKRVDLDLAAMRKHPRLGVVILAFVAFIALGMPDGLVGVAWPSIQASFAIPLDAIGFLLSAGVAGYLTSSFFSGPLNARWGVGKVLAASCGLTGVALIGYTLVPEWWMMVVLGVATGLGAGGIDAGLNAYVAAHFGERLMQWLHASYGIGVTLGPIIMTIALTAMGSWRTGYGFVGGAQCILAACFVVSLPIWSRDRSDSGGEGPTLLTDYKTPLHKTLSKSSVWLSMLLFFLYTGSEASLGIWAYSLLTESRGITSEVAGIVVGSYWATFTVGRVIAGLYTRRVGVNFIVVCSLVIALAGAVLLWLNPTPIANLIATGLVGFAIAPIFPAMVSGTSQRVGEEYAVNTIGMQVAAGGLGVAVLPSVVGILARRVSLEAIPVCLIVMLSGVLGVYGLTLKQSVPAWISTHRAI
jgi:fucose permease